MDVDQQGQPPAGFHFSNNQIKAINTLYGLCMGIVADGKINEREVLFLDTWLKDNQAYLNVFPLNVVADRVNGILADGVITQDECEDLYQILGKLLGGTLEETGVAGGLSTALPADPVDNIEFSGRKFCFTGAFVYGSRDKCEAAVKAQGGMPTKNVTKDLGYLVIGALASRDWVASSHGRKIEKALYFKDQGVPMLIITEEDWVRFV